MSYALTSNSYGKSRVRLTKVDRATPVHQLYEFDVAIQLAGDFEASYTQADNRLVVATDTMKNTVYVLAKENGFGAVEQFAQLLCHHFLKTYAHVDGAEAIIAQASWSRIPVDGKPHDHAFANAGTHHRYVRCHATRSATTLVGGVRNLLVLKTTGSAWADFHADRYRTLKDVHDRIVATRVDADWTFNALDADFDRAYADVSNAILTTFATRHSLGVQQTLMDMGMAALDACAAIDDVHFELPNMHRIPFNLDPFGLKFANDVFVATDEPHGLIKGTISRHRK
jgi:urate oxidase